MKFILCLFTIALSLGVYPIFLHMNKDLIHMWGYVEIDIFNWYRMVFVGLTGCTAFYFVRKLDTPVIWYLALLLLSTLFSLYPETSIYGTPMHHEGLIALIGYIGIYQFVVMSGFYKSLERALDVVVFIVGFVAILQILYGNFLNFPLFKAIVPKLEFQAVRWPLYSTLGGPNNLGLFCSLFFPYAIIKKKYAQVVLLLALAVGSQTRSAWISMFITTAFVSRKYVLYLIIASIVLCIPIHKKVFLRARVTWHQIHFPPRDGDLAGRIYMWKGAIPSLKKTLLIGQGPSTFPLYFPQFTKRGDDIGFENLVIDRPHNMYINIWQSTGLISLFILSSIVFIALCGGRSTALRLGVLGFLITGFFTDSMLSVTPYFLIFLGGLRYEYNEARRYDPRTERLSQVSLQ